MKDIAQKAKTPLGEKNIVYNIPCGCRKFSYTGETDSKWKTRKKEHMDKVRLTKEDIKNGNKTKATERINTGEQKIKWEGAMMKNEAEEIFGRSHVTEGER